MNSARPWPLMMRRMLAPAFSLWLLAEPVAAQSVRADLRFQPSREGPVWVGQQIELNLDVLSNGFSFSGQRFLLPDVEGAYLLQADSSTVNLSESLDGEAWQGLRYTILMYPQTRGVIEVPSFQVEFSVSSGYGSQPVSFQLGTPVLELEARLPPGVDSSGLVVTSTDFGMTYSWNRGVELDQPLQLKVGDALTLDVRRSADSVPGMVFAPLPELMIDGLRAYGDPPDVDDRINRGQLRGSRTDSVTFICEREGVFEIPPMTFQWWNPETEVVQQEVIPGVTLEVAANSAFLTTGEPDAGQAFALSIRDLLFLLIGLIVVAWGAWKLSGVLPQWLHMRRMARESSEPWAFRQAISACQAGAAKEAYATINRWLARVPSFDSGMTLIGCAGSTGRREFLHQAELLQAAVISADSLPWDGKALARELERFRSEESRHQVLKQTLPPLNPGS